MITSIKAGRSALEGSPQNLSKPVLFVLILVATSAIFLSWKEYNSHQAKKKFTPTVSENNRP